MADRRRAGTHVRGPAARPPSLAAGSLRPRRVRRRDRRSPVALRRAATAVHGGSAAPARADERSRRARRSRLRLLVCRRHRRQVPVHDRRDQLGRQAGRDRQGRPARSQGPDLLQRLARLRRRTGRRIPGKHTVSVAGLLHRHERHEAMPRQQPRSLTYIVLPTPTLKLTPRDWTRERAVHGDLRERRVELQLSHGAVLLGRHVGREPRAARSRDLHRRCWTSPTRRHRAAAGRIG